MTPQPDNHVEEDIPVYLTGGLSPDQRRAFESHTASCPQCAAALEQAKSLESQMTILFTPARPSEGLEDRIIQKFRKSGIGTNRPLIHPMVRKVAVGIAAAVVLGVMGVVVSNSLMSESDRSGGSVLARTASTPRAMHSETEVARNVSKSFYAKQWGNETTAPTAGPVRADAELDTRRRTDSPRQERATAQAVDSIGAFDGNKVLSEVQTSLTPNRGLSLGVERDGDGVADVNKKLSSERLGTEIIGKLHQVRRNPSEPEDFAFKPQSDLKFGRVAEEDQKVKDVKDSEGKKPTSAQQTPAMRTELYGVAKTQDLAPNVWSLPAVGQAPADPFAAAPSTQPSSSRKVIRNGTLQFEVDRFDDALMRVTKLVGEQGGYVATTDSDKLPNGKTRGTITLRVPPEHLDSLVLMLRGIGDLKSQKIGAEDVTKHYTDLESQLRAARAMQDRLLEIIKTGKGQIKDLLEAEKQLGVWREKIEQIEGEKRYIDNVVALATLSVELTERDIRTPATASEVEQVAMSLETEKVDEAYEKARAAIESAKGRILQSELKQFDAGQFGATIQATVPPDAAEQLIARLRQLDGRIAHFERQNKRTTRPGEGPITGLTNLHREDAVISMQIYNLANIAPRRTTTVVLATETVDAAYQKALDQIRSAGGRVVTSALFKPDAQQQTADLDFQVPTEKSATVEDALRALGEVMRNDSAENPDTANVTEAKRGFRLHLVSTASVSPRETQDAQLVAADVPAAFNQILAAVTSAGGRVLQSDLKEQDPRDVTANLSFEIPRSSLATVNLAVSKAAQQLTRNVTRSNDTQNTLDSKLRLTYAIASADRLPARQNVTIREEVTDVEKAVDDLTNAANSAGGRRVGGGDVSQDQSGHVTAQVVVEVPLDKAPTILDQLEHTGNRRGKQVSYNPQTPDGPLARARIDVTFSNSAATLGGEESTWDAIRRGLATSALGLRWSLQMLIIGLCFVAPWSLVIWAAWKLTRRRKPAVTTPAA